MWRPIIFFALCFLRVTRVQSEKTDDDDELESFTFDCGAKKILMLHNATREKIIANCYIPYICGEVKFCATTLAPACVGKFQYLEGFQIVGKTVRSMCCTPNPLPNGDESCREVPIFDEVLLPKVTPPGAPGLSFSTPKIPRLDKTTPTPPKTSPKPNPLAPRKNSRHIRALPSESRNGKVEINLAKLNDIRFTDEYVKAIKALPNGYSLTVCTPFCSSSTSTVTRTPTTPTQKRTDKPTTQVRTEAPKQKETKEAKDVHPPKKGLFGGNGHGCFSSDMTVGTPDGVKRMDELQLGDKVQVFTAESSTQFQPITWFHHRDPKSTMKYLDLKTASGHQLSITSNHLISLIDCHRKLITASEMDKLMINAPKFASRAKIGSCLAVQAEDGQNFKADMIVKISQQTKAGLYSPITKHGSIVVNGVQTSCFSSVENHVLLRSIHSTWETISNWIRHLYVSLGMHSEKVCPQAGIPPTIKFLLEVAKRVMPEYVYSY